MKHVMGGVEVYVQQTPATAIGLAARTFGVEEIVRTQVFRRGVCDNLTLPPPTAKLDI